MTTVDNNIQKWPAIRRPGSEILERFAEFVPPDIDSNYFILLRLRPVNRYHVSIHGRLSATAVAIIPVSATETPEG